MALKPWYKIVTPREDLREGKPLDASEFAVHLDNIRDGKAPVDYQDPERFFERTYLTKNLSDLASSVVRRLSGEKVETNAVYNMTTQFGGGKTHALALLYHLAKGGSQAKKWKGVNSLIEKANVSNIPESAIAIFVGQKFDTRGGDDGTPLRRTPWGEIAWQLGGNDAFKIMAKYDEDGQAPGGDTISKLFSKKKPTLILIDELMNYVSRYRKSGLSSQLYNFLQNLTEEARSHDNVVLAVSIPASELEMSADDESDYTRFKKLLDRLGKAVIMSTEEEISEIIRRRLFEWHGLPDEGKKVAGEYADWMIEHKQQIPNWFPVDTSRETFMATYPFHPSVFSVFERKWQALPKFQQTRGVLRLLALWVSKVYQDGYKGDNKDPLITLGTAPLEDSTFRAAVFEQLGESRLEGALTTDITGKKDAHAVRLDNEAVDTIKKSRLHQKVATTIFFESNGGQARAEATLPEIRLAVAETTLDIGNVETVLEALTDMCYFIAVEKNKYRFSILPNLNKILADRRASIQPQKIEERVKSEVQKIFSAGSGAERVYFPEKSNQIADRPVLTVVILSPEHSLQEVKKTHELVEQMTKEYGTSARTFKSALIWCVPDNAASLHEEARKLLAWEDIQDELDELKLDESQKHQLSINLKKAQRDLKESVWRTYHKVTLLGKNNELQTIDLGLTHSSSAESLITSILNRLRQEGHVETSISPNFLVRNWPPAFKEWSTKSVRNAFFASPQFPRLLNPDSIRDTIARGVANKMFAYVGKPESGKYKSFYYDTSLSETDIEISDDMFIITGEEARKSIEPAKLTRLEILPSNIYIEPRKSHGFMVKGFDQHNLPYEKMGKVKWTSDGGVINDKGIYTAGNIEGQFQLTALVGEITTSAVVTISKEKITEEPKKPQEPKDTYKKLTWQGEIQPQKWMNFYTKVLAKHAKDGGLKITLKVDIAPPDGVSKQKVEDTKVSLRELGLDDEVDTE
jgi:hypothetical protein